MTEFCSFRSSHLRLVWNTDKLYDMIVTFIIAQLRVHRGSSSATQYHLDRNFFVLNTTLLKPIGYYFPASTTTLCGIHFFLVGFHDAAFLTFNFLFLAERTSLSFTRFGNDGVLQLVYVIHEAMSEDETIEVPIGQCSCYYWTLSYTRLILLIDSVYQFFSYVSRSKDFCTGLDQNKRYHL